MLNDYFWFRFFQRRRSATRFGAFIILPVVVIAGLVYAAVFIVAATHGVHSIHAH